MASHSVTQSKHATLAAGVVDTVALTASWRQVEVLNRGGTVLYFTANPSAPAPTVDGDNTVPVMPGGAVTVDQIGPAQIRLVSAAAVAYSVTGS